MAERTERDKMLAGDTYNCLDPDLVNQRLQVKDLLSHLNRSRSPAEQREILQRLLGGIGRDTIIEPPFHCSYGSNIYLGDLVYLNVSCTIIDCGEVRIGHHVMIGPNVQLYTAAHHLQAESRTQGWEIAKPITIEDNVWLGGGVIVLPGVTVGRNAVVGAGAVVTRDVPANMVAAGNPARLIREIQQE